MPLADYLLQLGERLVIFGVPIASLAGAYWLLGRQAPAEDVAISRANDTPALISGATFMRLAAGVAIAMLFVYLHLELGRSFGYFYAPLKLPILTLLWLAMCGLILFEAVARRSQWLTLALLVGVACVFGKVLFIDIPSWHLADLFLYQGHYSLRDGVLRLIDFGAVIGFLAGSYALLTSRENQQSAGNVLGFASLGMLFLYLTLEVNTILYTYVQGLRPGGISILWSLFALGLILRGIAKNEHVLRYLGLALFAIVVAKIFFSDLSQLDQVYRIVAFILLGILVLAGSFMYLKYKESFAIGPRADYNPDSSITPPARSK
jgi:uncharacterized membrane protein